MMYNKVINVKLDVTKKPKKRTLKHCKQWVLTSNKFAKKGTIKKAAANPKKYEYLKYGFSSTILGEELDSEKNAYVSTQLDIYTNTNIEPKLISTKHYSCDVDNAIIMYNCEYLCSSALKFQTMYNYRDFIDLARLERGNNPTWQNTLGEAMFAISENGMYDDIYHNYSKAKKNSCRKIINDFLYIMKNKTVQHNRHQSLDTIINNVDTTDSIKYTSYNNNNELYSDIIAIDFYNQLLDVLTPREKQVLNMVVNLNLDESIHNKLHIKKTRVTFIKNQIQKKGDKILKANNTNLMISDLDGIAPTTVARCRNDIKNKARNIQKANGDDPTYRRKHKR